MSIAIKFPALSRHPEGIIWVYLNGVYWLNKSNTRWFINGVHPQGTETLCSETPKEAEDWSVQNSETEAAFPMFLAAVAAKKAELKDFVETLVDLDKIEAIKIAREKFDLSLKDAKDLVEGCTGSSTKFQATPLPPEVFPLTGSNYPTVEEDFLCQVKGLWCHKPIPASLLTQVEDLIEWREPLFVRDFTPVLVNLLSTGVCYGETDKLALRFKIDVENETTSLYDWKLREPGKSWFPGENNLRVTSLEAAPSLYSMYLAGKAAENEDWKSRLGDLIGRK